MPKRKIHDRLKKYEEKIRKLKEKEERRHKRCRNSSSSEDETNQDMVITENQSGAEPEAGPSSKPDVDTVAENDTIILSTPDPGPEDGTDPEPVISLDPELLLALGASTSDTPDFGANIHDSLANLWTPLLKKGLNKEEKDIITKENLIPGNCTFLQAPKLNAEISAAVSDVVRGRDKKFVGFQQQLGSGISAVNRAMDVLLSSDNKIQALKHLSDGCRLLVDLHYALTKDRIKLITPSLEKSFLHMIQDSERDDTLFGNTLSDKIKASKAIERQGSQIRKTMAQPKAATSSTTINRPFHQGNWSGAPRYPANRGGRGVYSHRGPRGPPPLARRPYAPPYVTQQKNFTQPRPRAPPQQ